MTKESTVQNLTRYFCLYIRYVDSSLWYTGLSLSWSRSAKMTHKSVKIRKFMFWCARCSILWAEGFFCNLYLLYGSLGIGKFYFFIQNFFTWFVSCKFFQFLVIENLYSYRCSAVKSVKSGILKNCLEFWIQMQGNKNHCMDPDPQHSGFLPVLRIRIRDPVPF